MQEILIKPTAGKNVEIIDAKPISLKLLDEVIIFQVNNLYSQPIDNEDLTLGTKDTISKTVQYIIKSSIYSIIADFDNESAVWYVQLQFGADKTYINVENETIAMNVLNELTKWWLTNYKAI